MTLRLPPLVATVVLSALAACHGSDPRPFSLVAQLPVTLQARLAGDCATGTLALHDSSSLGALLKIYRQDAADPDLLLDLGQVETSPYPATMNVSPTTVLLAFGSTAHLVDFGGLAPSQSDVATGLTIEHGVAEGRWLLVADGASLELVDRDEPTSRFAFSAAAPVTGLLSTHGEFLAFTTAGYVRVEPDPVAPVFTESIDTEIRGFASGCLDGTRALVAGPSPIFGRSRVASLDLGDPESPALAADLDVAGNYGGLAANPGGTSLLELREDDSSGSFEGYLIDPGPEHLTATGVALPLWMYGRPRSFLHADRLYLLIEPLESWDEQFSIWRLE